MSDKFIKMTAEIHAYVERFSVRHDPLLERLAQETAELNLAVICGYVGRSGSVAGKCATNSAAYLRLIRRPWSADCTVQSAAIRPHRSRPRQSVSAQGSLFSRPCALRCDGIRTGSRSQAPARAKR